MSVTGRSEDFSAKATSWETLALPVPINTAPEVVKHLPRLTNVKSSLSETSRIKSGSPQGLNKAKDEEITDSVKSFERHEHENDAYDVKSGDIVTEHVENITKYNKEKSETKFDTHDTTTEHVADDIPVTQDRKNVYSASALYVASKPQKANEIDTIINEFETYARKSRAKACQDTKANTHRPIDDTADMSITSLHEKDREKSMEESPLARDLTRNTAFLKEDSDCHNNMNNSDHNKTNSKEIENDQTDNHLPPIANDHDENKSYDKKCVKGTTTRHVANQSTPKPPQSDNDSVSKSRLGRHSTGARSSTCSNMTAVVRPNPVGHDHRDLPSVTDNSTYCHSCSSNIFHPPPAPLENGISRENLVMMLSTGLSDFTEEMSVVVMDKLRGEFEGLAERVGHRVKEEAITELKQLKNALALTEDKVQTLTEERDKLRLDIVKERETMKKEYERERLKRVKEFEEQIEHREKLEAEVEKLQKQLKDKEKIAKKAVLKVKQQEEKATKIEEEFLAKTKDIQKQLDKAKGDLLVKTSKKRLKTSSARQREETRLVSHHGSRPYKIPTHVPYVEGDP